MPYPTRRFRLPMASLPLMAATCYALALLMLAACGGASSTATETTGTGTNGTSSGDVLAPYYIAFALCTDAAGPDCTKLRLGDAYLSTTSAGVGKLYSCNGPNPNAGGSNKARITWIDDANATWNLLRKPWLPSGTFAPASGTYTVQEANGTRTITVNNLPVDGKIGDWPMSRYAALTAIDGNPGTPAARTYTFALPIAPTVNVTPACVPLGAIGVTKNGVVIYNAADGRGNDAVANEIVDAHGGHPAQTDYHYHFIPERLDNAPLTDGHSGVVGYIRDGFAIYGYKGVGGVELRNTDLDECHGHSHGSLGYHYHATLEYPYTVGCYRGTPR
ncbi:MAG: YHYH protein [Gemmatimonadaceae bacterium]|nr:YHYH protein [Gemmatimonadaceae bacterium]